MVQLHKELIVLELVQYKIKIMKIYTDLELLDFENVHLSVFENRFFEQAEKLPNMVEPNFSSLIELKNKNKDLLELAFNAELVEQTIK